MVANERRPSEITLALYHYRIMLELTHSCNDLCLQAILVGEASCKVADSTLTITSNIWNFSDVVEHVSTGEEENRN